MNEEQNERVIDQLLFNLVESEDMKMWHEIYTKYAKYFCMAYNAAKSQKMPDELANDFAINMILTQWEQFLDAVKPLV